MKLFISYSRDDKAWTYELWRQIRDELGHDAWIDRRIVPASDWWETILENIEAADVFVYVMTPKAVESIYCRGELDYALALNKPVLPLMLKPCDVPGGLRQRRVQYQVISDDLSMDKVLLKVEQGLGEVRLALVRGKYAPREAPRPDVPKPQHNPEHTFEAFAIAEEAAAEGNMTLAEQLFGQVMEADPRGLGLAAKERLNEIMTEHDRETAYANVRRLAENPTLLKGARAAWRAFTRTYPGYDPDKLAAKLSETATPAAPGRVLRVDVPAKAEPVNIVDELTRRTLDILPPPFAWIDIPAGKVTLEGRPNSYIPAGEYRGVGVLAFMIAKYPVTNAQFARFIEAGGYTTQRWWTAEGWAYRQREKWQAPDVRARTMETLSDHPVVGVSWFEAVAFCRWLGDTLNARLPARMRDIYTVTLPTEAQWQRAAQGDAGGGMYPWREDTEGGFTASWRDESRQLPANTKTAGVGRTTPVTAYAGKGDSPFGVVDMSGNVWEWCLTDFWTGSNDVQRTHVRRVLRGGAWNTSNWLASVTYRRFYPPGDRVAYHGFRAVCVHPTG